MIPLFMLLSIDAGREVCGNAVYASAMEVRQAAVGGMLVGAVLTAVAIPLFLNMIGPNRFYGFRTPATLGNREIWYAANKYSARDIIVFGICFMIFNAGLFALKPCWPRDIVNWMLPGVTMTGVMVILIRGLVFISRLKCKFQNLNESDKGRQ